MVAVSQYAEAFWHLDLHEDDLAQFGVVFGNRIPSENSRRFNSCMKASDAILQGTTNRVLPKIFVSDRVGATQPVGHRSVLSLVQELSPLTLSFLCSLSAFDDLGSIEHWKKNHLIIEAFRKTEMDQLAVKMQHCLQRWERPVVRQFREYILTECPDPETRYFPSDDGSEFFNVYDLHREIVLGTRLGLEQEKSWEITLNQKGNPFVCGMTGA